MNDEEQLKILINNFVWMHGPSRLMLQDAESLAKKIFILFMQAQASANNEPTPSYQNGDKDGDV